MFCTACGRQLAEGTGFCPACGTAASPSVVPPPGPAPSHLRPPQSLTAVTDFLEESRLSPPVTGGHRPPGHTVARERPLDSVWPGHLVRAALGALDVPPLRRSSGRPLLVPCHRVLHRLHRHSAPGTLSADAGASLRADRGDRFLPPDPPRQHPRRGRPGRADQGHPALPR